LKKLVISVAVTTITLKCTYSVIQNIFDSKLH